MINITPHYIEKCKQLYNSKQKQAFLQDRYPSEAGWKTALNILCRIAPFEYRLERDLCCMNREELSQVFDEILTMRSSGTAHVVNIVRDYNKWCIAKRIEGVVPFSYTPPKGGSIEKTRERMVVSPVHLQYVLDGVYRKESDQTVDNIYRAFFWLAFMGFPQKIAVQITKEHVSFDDMTISIFDYAHKIYPEALPALKNAVNLSFFYTTNAPCKKDDEPERGWIRRERIDGDWILRGLVSPRGPSGQVSLDERVLRLRKTIENNKMLRSRADGGSRLHLTYDSVLLSGIFFRQYEIERFTRAYDFRPIAQDMVLAKSERARQDVDFLQKQVYVKTASLKNDYAQWKAAFEL